MLYSDQGGYLSPFSLHTSSTNLISQKFNDSAVILAISVSAKRCTLELSVLKAQGSIAGLLFFLPFCHSRKIFKDHFVTACGDFGVALSNNFLSSSAFFRLPKSPGRGRHVLFVQFKTRVRFDFLAY